LGFVNYFLMVLAEIRTGAYQAICYACYILISFFLCICIKKIKKVGGSAGVY
jgi:hypothetical protein